MVSRRDFLRVGSLSVVGLSVADQAALARARDSAGQRSCILILMTGGPSQFETFDPKPEAPSEIRGPLRTIQTNVPGIQLSDGFPRLAKRIGQLAVLRSLFHQAAPIHETGYQLLQTGRLSRGGCDYPSIGSVTSRVLGAREGAPAYVVLPRLLTSTGVDAYRGQQAGFLGTEFDPVTTDSSTDSVDPTIPAPLSELELGPEAMRQLYGESRFGRLCCRARQLVEEGVRCVTVNLFDRLTNEITWDCHANPSSAPGTLFDYRDTLCPNFDRALSGLIDDLDQRGLLDDTLIVATGEFGRTCRLNENGGRDHWPGVWSALVAGGGISGGQVIGTSDAYGAMPVDRPIEPAELTATIYRFLGIQLDSVLATDTGTEMPLVEKSPIDELFG